MPHPLHGPHLRSARPRAARTSGRPRRARPALLVLGLAALLLVGACANVGTQGPAQAAPAAPPPELARFYDQQLRWEPCAGYAPTSTAASSFADPQLDCTRVTVPQDYARPDGATMQIALLRKKATGNKIGSLFFDPGGPGGSGTAFLAGKVSTLAPTPLGDRFDMIGFDPRGTGASRPEIRCLTDAEADQERDKQFVDPSPAGVAAAEANAKLYADRCAQRTGTDVLANVGTRDVAKDMDVMRAAVGDEKMSYAGFSYGTELGTAYAEAFPQNVRALLLDGAIDPTQSTIESSVSQNAGFQLAFDNFAKDCTTRPNCPLGTDPARATRNFQVIMQRLIDRPVPVGDGRTLNFTDAQTGVSTALYVSEYWPILQRGISEVASGQGRILKLLADSYNERDEQGRYSNMLQAFQSISCVNQQPVTDPAQVRELAERADKAAPFRSTGRGPVAAKDPCAFWPVPPTSEPHVPKADNLPPTMVVSVTGDPATPFRAGVDLARQLGGRLLKVNGSQHTAALAGDPCVDRFAIDYLVDLKLPQEGAECTLAPA